MKEEEAAVLNLTNFKDLSNSKAVCIPMTQGTG